MEKIKPSHLTYWYCWSDLSEPEKGVILIKSDNNSKCCAECVDCPPSDRIESQIRVEA